MDVTAHENFRRNLATAIEARELKKSRVAADCKTSRSYLDDVLKGDKEPGISGCERLARAVGFPLIALLDSPQNFSDSVLTTVRG
jgi:transcriptional regulator with XRE-family HTH domain